MRYDIFPVNIPRTITLCGTNIYPTPEYHPDRIIEDHDLTYIIDGTWQVAQDGIVYDLKAGDILLLRAGSHHWGTALCPAGSRSMFIHFSKTSADRLNTELSAVENRTCATGNLLCLSTVTHCGTGHLIGDLFRSAIQIYWGHQDDKERRLSIMLMMILNELASVTRNSQPESQEWITHLLDTMTRERQRVLTLQEAAEIAGMNERIFSTRFRKMIGKSFHQYQIDQKLILAYDTLRTGRYTVKETAAECGFDDPYYFSRLFHRKFGVTPSEIRRGEPSANIDRPNMR